MPIQFLQPAERLRLESFPAKPSKADLAKFMRLSPADFKLISKLRGDKNRLGFSLQLCSLRFLGFFPKLDTVPDIVIDYVAEQLGVSKDVLEYYAVRERTLGDHRLQIMKYLGFSRISATELVELEQWLTNKALEHNDYKILFDLACEHLYQLKIVRIGITRIEKLVGTARRQAREIIYKQLSEVLSDENCQFLDNLLLVKEKRRTPLAWLQRKPKDNSIKSITETIAKIEFLKAQGVDSWDLSALHPKRLKELAEHGATTPAQDLRETKAIGRYPIIVAFLQERLILFTVLTVEMFHQRLSILVADYQKITESESILKNKVLKKELKTLSVLDKMLLDNPGDSLSTNLKLLKKSAKIPLEQSAGRTAHDKQLQDLIKQYNDTKSLSELLIKVLYFNTPDRFAKSKPSR